MVSFVGRRTSIVLACLVALCTDAGARAQAQDPRSGSGGSPPAAGGPDRDAENRALAFWLGRAESDNIARGAVQQNGSYNSLGVLTDLGRTSAWFETNLDTDLEFRSYSDDTIDDEIVGRVNASADVTIVPELFSWDFRETYDQATVDQFAAIGPNNRESINVISSGPQLDFALGARTILAVGGEYSARRYSNSQDSDSDSATYELGLYRTVSQTSRAGLVASNEDIEYSYFASPPYDIDRLSIRYEKELATGRVLADIGTNEVSFGETSSDEPMYNFVWSRSLTARSALTITATRAFGDSGSLVAPSLIGDPVNSDGIVIAPDPLEQTAFAVSYFLTMTRTDLSVTAANSDEAYLNGGRADNDVGTTRFAIHRVISPRLDVGLTYDRLVRKFDDASAAIDGEDKTWSAWLSRTLGPRLNVSLTWSRYERTGNASLEEDRYVLRLGYNAINNQPGATRSVGR